MKRFLLLTMTLLTLSSVKVSAKEYLPYEEYMYTDYYTHENIDLVYDYDYAYAEYLKAHPQEEKKEVKKNATKKKFIKKTKKTTKHRGTKKKKSSKKRNVRKTKKTSKKHLTKKH